MGQVERLLHEPQLALSCVFLEIPNWRWQLEYLRSSSTHCARAEGGCWETRVVQATETVLRTSATQAFGPGENYLFTPHYHFCMVAERACLDRRLVASLPSAFHIATLRLSALDTIVGVTRLARGGHRSTLVGATPLRLGRRGLCSTLFGA